MFMTRVPVNMSRRSALRMLASPYRMHAAIESSFPACEPSVRVRPRDGRLLWRVDRSKKGTHLYIVSPDKPSLIGLDEQIGFPDIAPQYNTCDYEPFLASLQDGQAVSFRLTANPITKKPRKGAPQGTPYHDVPCMTPEQQLAWLIGRNLYQGKQNATSRLSRAGLEEIVTDDGPQVMVTETRQESIRKGSRRPIALTVARYDGLATISDADRLRHTLVSGLGHAKGFGCGLLTVAPVSISDSL